MREALITTPVTTALLPSDTPLLTVMANEGDEGKQLILGYAGAISRDPTGTDITFPVTSLIAIMEGPAIASVIGEGSGRDANDLRALANLAGMLDHVRSVQSSE